MPSTFPHQTVQEIEVTEEVVSPEVSKLNLSVINKKQRVEKQLCLEKDSRKKKMDWSLVTQKYITSVGGSILQEIFYLSQNVCYAIEKNHQTRVETKF